MTAQVSSQLRDFSQDSYSSSATEEPYLLAAHGGSRPTKGNASDSQQSGVLLEASFATTADAETVISH